MREPTDAMRAAAYAMNVPGADLFDFMVYDCAGPILAAMIGADLLADYSIGGTAGVRRLGSPPAVPNTACRPGLRREDYTKRQFHRLISYGTGPSTIPCGIGRHMGEPPSIENASEPELGSVAIIVQAMTQKFGRRALHIAERQLFPYL